MIKKLGGIDYHIPLMNKTKLAREGRLPNYLSERKEIIYKSLRYFWYKGWKEHVWSHFFYLGINDEKYFHQTTAKTVPTQASELPTNEQTIQASNEPTFEQTQRQY